MKNEKKRAVIAGNWKMNKTPVETAAFIEELRPLVASAECDVIVCVPFTSLDKAVNAAKGSNIMVGAQNCHWAESGAFTGEVSARMLSEIGAQYVIIGHSERRQYFGETDVTVNMRLHAALDNGLFPILCVGETLEQRELGVTMEVLSEQMKIALKDVTDAEIEKITVAYEPVWAIGTGRSATSEQANEACRHIRAVVAELYSREIACGISVQYGGSMNASNACELLEKPDINGGLIGGASLKTADFARLIEIASK